jgi:hypothetical protein
MADKFKIEWVDRGVEPREKPDPNFPDGIDLNMAMGRSPSCKVTLPYPAPRCGYYYVECKTCGENVLLSTAGRRDDPRSVTLACDLTMLRRLSIGPATAKH